MDKFDEIYKKHKDDENIYKKLNNVFTDVCVLAAEQLMSKEHFDVKQYKLEMNDREYKQRYWYQVRKDIRNVDDKKIKEASHLIVYLNLALKYINNSLNINDERVCKLVKWIKIAKKNIKIENELSIEDKEEEENLISKIDDIINKNEDNALEEIPFNEIEEYVRYKRKLKKIREEKK